MMVQGILASDLINTVSPTYAKEILTKEYGAGLEKVLALRKKRLYGILNGIDTDFFNPETDKLLTENYSSKSLEKRLGNKLTLQKKFDLAPDETIALAGIVTRFVKQKGIELITEKLVGAIDELPLSCQFVFLGTGEKRYEEALLDLVKKYPKKFSVQIKFDEKLAHEIYAGSDMFLVPSRFEPCGLTQMIAMRYGSVPIVRATGGLKDTVAPLIPARLNDVSRSGGKGVRGIKPTGFTFKNYNADELYKTLAKALNIFYRRPKVWRQLQLNGMKQDFSWKKSADTYLKLYKKIIN
jgi:starch synthase